MRSSSRTVRGSRIRIATTLAAAAAALFVQAALAYPEGSPWGAADPDADESCSACHYGYEPRRDSAALDIAGLPRQPAPAQDYELVIRFADDNAVVSGFQLLAAAAGGDAGRFRSDDENIEAIGAASRSTAAVKIEGSVSWRLTWRTPDDIRGPIVLLLAASAANDDQSPFGDTIHYRSFELSPAATD